ncbi:nuclear protein [Thoreauomyces humboldtii]|nr:nuclear protein [Thoreauomyces humboldtii]
MHSQDVDERDDVDRDHHHDRYDNLPEKDFGTQQSEEDRRRLRQRYRELNSYMDDNRNQIDTMQLIDQVRRADSLFKNVYTTHEATLDSSVLIKAAELGVTKAQRMRLDGGSFNIDDWMGKLVVKMNGRRGGQVHDQQRQQQQEEEEEEVTLDWHALGPTATRCLLRVPTIDFMLGPLSVEAKTRAVNRKPNRLVKDKADLQKPQMLKESDFERQENETTGLVMSIAKRLDQLGVVPFFRFVINPESFGQSVENLFYVSFLVRDGKAMIDEDEEEGDLMLQPGVPPRPEEYENNEVQRMQAVVDFDKPTWRALIHAYGITESCIPTRPPTSFATASGKWYG